MRRLVAILWLLSAWPGSPEVLAPAAVSSARAHAPAPQRTSTAAAATAPANQLALEKTRLLAAFSEDLQELRRGNDEVAPRLLELAAKLSDVHGRDDVLDIAHYYTALSRSDRARGLAAYDRYAEQYRRVGDARRAQLADAAWAVLRDDLLASLEEIFAATPNDGDPAAAANALALHADLLVTWAESLKTSDRAETQHLARQALEQTELASKLFERIGMVTPTLEPLWVHGRAARLLGSLSQARRSFEHCLATAERVDFESYQRRALLGLVRLAREVGDAQSQERLLSELSRLESPGDSWAVTLEYTSFLLHEDHSETVLRTLERFQPTRESEREAWSHMAGSAALRSGDLPRASAYFDRLSDGDAARIARAHLDLAQGSPARVLAVIEPLVDADRLSPHDRAQALSILGEAQVALGRTSEAVTSLRQALLEAERWRARLDPSLGENVIGEWVGVQTVATLARALSVRGEHLEAARTIEEFQSRGLREAALDGASEPRARLEPGDLQAWAAHTELGLVTWVVGADTAVVAHVAADGSAWSTSIEHGRVRMREAVRRLREAALNGDDDGLRQLGRELGAELLPPELRERLRSPRPEDRALFLLHGPLEGLPVSCLTLGEHWLDETLTALVLPGLPAARPGASVGTDLSWTLIGGWAGSDELPALPAAQAELEAIAALHPGASLLTNAEGNLERTKHVLHGHGGLHVATHLSRSCGHEASRLAPLGLVLGDGQVLCAHLVADEAPALPLVVLSACESGGGDFVDAEGLQGLARAFLEAGTRNLLVTLWPVEDGAARSFAVHFHESLGRGVSPAVAVGRARAALRSEGAAAADWAAYQLLGRD